MNKTRRFFVATLMALVTIMSTMFTGCSFVTNEPTPTHKHDLTKVSAKAPTCEEDGNVEYYVCSTCDGAFADSEGQMALSPDEYIKPAKGHEVLKHGGKDATCSTVGVKEHYECRWCHTLFKDAEGMFEITEAGEIPTLSHSLTLVPRKEAAGFVAGYEEHYVCSNCDSIYKDAAGLIETTKEAIKIAPTLTDFVYKIAYTPAANINSFNGTNGGDYISAAYTKADGLPATDFTFKAGATANMEVTASIINAVTDAKSNGQNLRIPTFSGKARKLDMTVTNSGAQEISFRYYAENWGDQGGVDVTVAAGETKTVTFEVKPGQSIGCNYALKLLSNVTEETKVTMYGYFYCEGEVESVSLYKEATKKSFKVGESFTTEGLVVKANGNLYDDVVIANYLTDLTAGYTFTAEDVGTRTITVAYGEYTTTYDITITA